MQIIIWKALIYMFESNVLLNPSDFPVNEIVQLGVSTLYKYDCKKFNGNFDESSEQLYCLKAFSYMIRNEVLQSEAWKNLKSSKEEKIRMSQTKEKGSTQIL